jgi:hypothetical protein
LVLSFIPVAELGLDAQQPWQQNPQYANSQYVQPNPNYVGYPQNKPSPYQYPQQPGPQQQQPYPDQQQPYDPQQPGPQQQQPYPDQQQPYAGKQQPYPDQQQPYPDQQQPYPQQQQYAQQPYMDPGQDDDAQYAQQPQQGGQPFAAEQLEQLVAPIALYPDALIAQILAASTYPAQVVAADNWLRSQGYASPDQIAYAADAQTNWDPSVKALTAFPQVLDMMNRDLRWTTDLGNAYYNQPQDVLQTIQVMRQRAQSAGTLQSTPQEAVSYNQGYIQLAPTNPQVVYVPAYNPWSAYGQPVAPYPGFSLTDAFGAIGSFLGTGMRFGAGIGMAAFSHTPFGWAGWVLNWLASSIFFHQSPYYSHSTSVAHWGGSRGGGYGGSQMGGINRTPNGYPRPQQGNERFGNSYAERGFSRPPVRAPENYAYSRPQPQAAMPVRPQTYARPGGYGSGFYASQPRVYSSPQQTWRAPASTYQRNDFAQRSYVDRSYGNQGSYSGGRGFAESAPKQERSGGFHMFGGNHGERSFHSSYKAAKMPKAPKMSGGGHHGGGHGGGHHGR